MDKRPLILVVEDEKDNRELLTFQLELFNYSPICAENGLLALYLAKTRQPDLILLDIMLPDLNGNEVIHHLKQNPETEKIPIIAVTALAREQERDRILLAGASAYITKPYDIDNLEILIRQYLGQVEPFISPCE